MTGASVNFKAVKSAGHAVSHASREVAPTYLLPPDKSMGTIVLLDDKGKVASILEAKMALASPRAKVDERYSPVWEGILNLRRPEAGEAPDEYQADCSAVVGDWCKSYEASTGHKVLRVDVHLDEGHMVEGEAVLNAHAHVIADRTTDLGRVIKLSPKQLRELQTLTAAVTGLERGKSSFETGRKHISHQAYKHLAERGRLETQQQVDGLKASHEKQLDGRTEALARLQRLSGKWTATDAAKIKDLRAQLDGEPDRLAAALKAQEDQLNEQYRLDRATMKASGEATQADYQALKKAKDAEIATLKIQLKTAQAEATGLQAELNTTNQKVEKMEKKITDQDAELVAVKAKFAAMANAYQAEKAKGTAAHLIVPSIQPAVLTPAPIPQETTRTASEAPKQPEAPIPPAVDQQALELAFLAFYTPLAAVEVEGIDGKRLDAVCGRLGVFSQVNGTRTGRDQVLCRVPAGKVMPEVGQVFDSRAVPGQGKRGRGG